MSAAQKPPPNSRRQRIAAPIAVALVALALMAVSGLLGTGIGTRQIAPMDVASALMHPSPVDPTSIIVWRLRLPRVVLALVVGCALGVAGVVMQALTRNPLAEPGILGVNAGASLAVVLATALLHVGVGTSVWFALVGAGGAALLVFRIGARGTGGPAQLVLAGAAFAACVSAVIGIVTMWDATVFADYRAWVVGSFADRGGDVILSVLPFIAGGLVLALAVAFPLNAVALGDDQARALGVNIGVTRAAGVVAVVLLSGGATAAAGPISFVGLLIPHALTLCRIADVRVRTVLGAMIGAALLVTADLIGRVVLRPGELQVGIVVAMIGAPLLAWLVLSSATSRGQAVS